MFYDFPLIFKDGRAKQTDQREDSATKALPEPVLAGLGTSSEEFYCLQRKIKLVAIIQLVKKFFLVRNQS